jgi:hypothetical protein
VSFTVRPSFALASLVVLGLLPSPASADSTSAPVVVRCSVTTPSAAVVATFEDGTMHGTVTVDGTAGTRRFKVKAAPQAATYNLVFDGYAAGDQKPASEALTKGKSLVARLVAYGDTNHLFLDGDYHPPLQAPQDGFVCQ